MVRLLIVFVLQILSVQNFTANCKLVNLKRAKMCVSNAYEYHCMVHLYSFIGWPQKMAGKSNFLQQLIHLG